MDPYSSGEKFNIKTRKPYTITKQRERWTEDEHNSFLEALKLYGRAWQRIEDHIGTKTAVQIRSHAQKFFTKLEKEALAKGVPIRQALDMEIPPPRPKRKPNYPYPRKTGPNSRPQVAEKDGKQPTEASPLQSGIQTLDLETKSFPEITSDEEKLEDAKTGEEMEYGNGTEVSFSSENENSLPKSFEAINPGVFREFIPTMEVVNHDETNESHITTIETSKQQKPNQDGIKNRSISSNTSLFASSNENTIKDQNSGKELRTTEVQGVQNYPRHVPVQVVNGNQGVLASSSVRPEISFQDSAINNKSGDVHQQPNVVVNIAASANTGNYNSGSRSSSYQTVPTFHPLFTTQFCDNPENYTSLLQVSSNISSLIVSSLLQNPAAHAAARFAATFWHPANTEASSGDSSARDHPSAQLNSETPSMAAIAAATVAAASAWWAAHGLLPVCTPFYPSYSCNSPCSFGRPIDENQAINAHSEGVLLQAEKMDVENRKTPQDLPKEHQQFEYADASSSEDSDGREDKKPNTETSPDDSKQRTPVAETNGRKQVDRSSCGSNTTSSSEIETDALEKHGKEEETKGSDVNLPCTDSNSRRSRTTISPNESWKEVSEEGRLAFQALFSREVLPQSFSDICAIAEKAPQNPVNQLDLNRMSCSSQEQVECNGFAVLRSEKNAEDGLLTMGLGGGMKLNVHHTGFKPYKRCSVEAKESKIVTVSSQNDEKGPKRMRLEAE